MSRAAKARRALVRLVEALGVALVFTCALTLGVYLHLNHPAARKVAVAETQAVLASLFEGQIVIDRVNQLGPGGLDGGAAHVVAPDGSVVLRIDGVRARGDVTAIVRSVLFGKGPIAIPLHEVHIDYAEVVLDATPDGTPKLRAAFTRKPPIPPKNPNARGVDLSIDPITIRHTWVHGQVPGTPPSDVDVDDVGGNLAFRGGALRVAVSRFTLRTRSAPRGLDAEGTGDARLDYPARSGAGVGLEGSFKGTVGGIGATLRAALDGQRVDVSLDVPRAPADKVRALFPDAPAQAELGVRIDAHGELPRLDVEAHATLGQGTLHVVGPVTVEGNRHATLTWDASALDLRAFGEKLPESNLQGKGTVDVAIAADASLLGTFTADVGAGTVTTHAVPPASLSGTFGKDAAGLHAHAQGHVHEAGAPAEITLDVAPDGATGPDGAGWVVDGTAHATVARLDAVPRIASVTGIHGAADVKASAKLHTKTGMLDGTLTADVRGFTRGTTTVGSARVTAHATGKADSPNVATTMHGDDVVLGTLRFPHADVTTRGTIKDQHVQATLQGDTAPDVKGTAEVSLGGKTTVRNADLTLTRDKVEVSVRVPTLRFGDGDLHIEDADIRGLGAPARASLDLGATSTQIRARSRGVSLARIGKLLHLEDGSLDGQVSFDVDLDLKEGGARGSVSATLTRATVLSRAATAEVHATADGRRWAADGKAMLAGVGDVALSTTDLALGPEGPLHAAAWQAAAGTVGMRGSVDLAQAAALAPKGTLTFTPAGILELRGAVTRGGPAHAISVSLAGGTRGLEVTTASTHVVGVEARLGASYDGSLGTTSGALVLDDATGEVARLDLQSDAVPYRDMWTSGGVRARLEVTPFVAKLVVPPRAVNKLPAGLALVGAHGTVQLTAELAGSVAAPGLKVAASARDFAAKGTTRSGWLSADVSGTYDGKAAHASAAVRTTRALILTGQVDANAKVAELLSLPAGDLPWDASGKIELLEFPLNRIALLSDHDVRGKVTGEIAIADYHKDARGSAKLVATSLTIGNVVFPKAQLDATVDDKEVRGKARLEQSVSSTAQNLLQQASMSAGFGELAGSVGIHWGRALTPTIDATRPMEATLATKRLRAAAFLPFVDAYLGELDGLVDANAIVSLMPGAPAPTIVGSAALENGVVQVASTGTELHGASARLTIGADGTVRLANVIAHGITGTLKAAASARLEGLSIVSAAGDVVIAKGEEVPIDLKGMQLGDVWGEAHAKAVATADRKTMNVTVDVPSFHAQLPLASSHSVKDREALKNVHVGVYSPGHFTKLALDSHDLEEEAPPTPARTLVVTLNLGPEVEVKRGTTLAATLEGSPQITVTDKPVVTGQIRLPTGALQVQGKKFEIEKGTVSFVGTDPSDPLVVVTAGWTAADGTRVYADFTGPLKSGKVTLRSEPSRPKDEILGLILFGSADQSTSAYGGDTQADTGTRAGGAAGTFATQGLSEGIDELTGLQIATKIDTSNAASPRPEVEVQLARTISLQIAFVLGTPFPNPDKTFATLGWRFADRWRLETTFGDAGSSFADVVWQLRY